MLKVIKSLLKRNLLLIAILLTVVVAVLSLIKISVNQSINITFLDKIEHVIAYFTIALFWLLALGKNKKAVFFIVILCVFYGVIIEILQVTITSYRTAEYLDALANTVGVLSALFFFKVFFKKK